MTTITTTRERIDAILDYLSRDPFGYHDKGALIHQFYRDLQAATTEPDPPFVSDRDPGDEA